MEGGASRIRDTLDAGLTIEALDLARKASVESPRNPELVYLAALACVRIGAIRDADRLLRQIEGIQVGDKTLATDIESLAGRIAKEPTPMRGRWAATAPSCTRWPRSITTSGPSPSAASRFPPSTPPRWRCSWATGAWRRTSPTVHSLH